MCVCVIYQFVGSLICCQVGSRSQWCRQSCGPALLRWAESGGGARQAAVWTERWSLRVTVEEEREERERSFIITTHDKSPLKHLSVMNLTLPPPLCSNIVHAVPQRSLGDDVCLLMNMRWSLEVLCENLQLWCEHSWIGFNFSHQKNFHWFFVN